MKMPLLRFIQLFAWVVVFQTGFGQSTERFAGEINDFRKKDSIQFPAKKQIVFTGSSSFRMWKDLQTSFPSYPIINRAFGGSTLVDLIRYVDAVIFPYEPKQVVIYSGDNDLASSDTVTPLMVSERFKTVFKMIRDRYKKLPIAFVSIKPSPSRRKLFGKMQETNRLIEKFLKKKKNTAFINVFDKMLNSDGSIMTDLWLRDSLHMNPKDYAIWQKEIEPYLVK
jgi:lysophospholipase L1-like esterase